MINRTLAPIIQNLMRSYPIVTVVGPRQSGKTTIVRQLFPDKPYVNLEKPDERRFAKEDPNGFLSRYTNGAVIDEIQRVPELSSYLQVAVDEDQRKGRFVLTGSQNFSIREALSQSLAGRTAIVTLLPLSLQEIANLEISMDLGSILYRGFYPRIFQDNLEPTTMYADYIATYVERDIRQLSMVKDLSLFQTFLSLCATRVGQILNLQSIANDCGIAQVTAREWLGLLEASYILYRLPPFHSNLGKRLIKRPKLYFYDTGLVAYLLGIESPTQAERHPMRGSLFENMVITDIIKTYYNSNRHPHLTFYRDSDGNEVDLLIPKLSSFLPIEIKSGQTINDDYFIGLKRLHKVMPERPYGSLIVYAGTSQQRRSDGVEAINFHYLPEKVRSFMQS